MLRWHEPMQVARAAFTVGSLTLLSRLTGFARDMLIANDRVNHATHEYKEAIKVGYNLRRKVLLYVAWALAPMPLFLDPTLFGLFEAPSTFGDYVHHVALIWLAVGVGGLLFRTVHLFFIHDLQTGLVWMLKILTDPFHDLKLYWKAPLALLRGELIDRGLEAEVAQRS